MNQTKSIYHPFFSPLFFVTSWLFSPHFGSIILKKVFTYKMLYNVAGTLETKEKVYHNSTVTFFFLVCSFLVFSMEIVTKLCITPAFLSFRSQAFCSCCFSYTVRGLGAKPAPQACALTWN